MNRERNLSRDLGLEIGDAGGPAKAETARIKALVNSALASAPTERRRRPMKAKASKTVIVAAIAALVLSVSVLASSGVITSWNSTSSSRPEYTALPTAEQCVKDIGFAPVLLESFSNGYSFKEGNVTDNSLVDDGGNAVEEFKGIDFTYKKDGDIVYFSQERFTTVLDDCGIPIAEAEGVPIYYYTYNNMIVPADYELTEEEKAAEEAGEVVFSYGADKPQMRVVHCAYWQDRDSRCGLLQIDGALTADELVSMAAEMIAAK